MLEQRLAVDAHIDVQTVRDLSACMVHELPRFSEGNEGQALIRKLLMLYIPHIADVGAQVQRVIASPPHFCVVRGLGFTEVSGDEQLAYIVALSTLFGLVSNNNRFDQNSAILAEEVRPTDPSGTDVTYTLGICEVHSDESSKLRPEDIVALWCVQPARDGGASMIWSVPDLIASLEKMEGGREHIARLRGRFPFGGKLRQPARVLLAPIFFGDSGVRFRMGAINDAFDVLGRPPDLSERQALDALVRAIAKAIPYEYNLKRGEVLVLMNRKTLHSRTDFQDPGRYLLKTRCFNQDLSNVEQDQLATWLQGPY